MNLQLIYQSVEDLSEFREIVWPALIRDLMPNHFLLGLVDQRDPTPAVGEELRFAVIRRVGGIVGAIVQTLPGQAVFSKMSPEVARFAYHEWAREHGTPSVIRGPDSSMNALLDEFSQRHPSHPPCVKKLLSYELTEVIMPAKRPVGRMRNAEAADEDLLVEWGMRFSIECELQEADSPDLEAEERRRAQRVIERRTRMFWEVDGIPVSMAGITRVSRFGSTVSAVYTPDAHRGKGYASQLVAELSSHLLGSGVQRCMLFTDARNPVSNAIYQRIGYRHAVDFLALNHLPAE
jgi:RimJ/RimL family protein N-acetyltransferase